MLDQPATEAPEFVRDSELLRNAYGFALTAHHGSARRGGTDIDHPLAVARLLADRGFDELVVAAALLHDVVEDSAIDLDQIERAFGPEVAVLVGGMTEDATIEPYERRKAEHRARVLRDQRVAAIYVADKVENTRALRSAAQVPAEKLEHYRLTLEEIAGRFPELALLRTLRTELEALDR